MRLSKHFVENWQKRVGGTPDPRSVVAMIKDSVVIQKGKRVAIPPIYHPGMQTTHTLSIYWQPEMGVIIGVDPFTRTAVSVLTKENRSPTQHRAWGKYR